VNAKTHSSFLCAVQFAGWDASASQTDLIQESALTEARHNQFESASTRLPSRLKDRIDGGPWKVNPVNGFISLATTIGNASYSGSEAWP
jgi:hypothetical protein